MADSSMTESIHDEGGDTSDAFSPEPKPSRAKAAPKKAGSAAPRAKSNAKAGAKKMTQTTLNSAKATAPKKRAKSVSDDENEPEEDESLKDDSLLSNTPPSAKRQKKAPAPKKSGGKPLQPMSNESHASGGGDGGASQSSKQEYQKLTQLEHILKRPDMYIGSVERTDKNMWVYNSQTDAIESRDVKYVPGLYKIFDEILVNAADNKQRDKNMDEIKVTVDREKGEISVQNNGRGIPIEIHSTEGIYVPEMIFGHLLTSSNYEDAEQKVTGGRNGYGAKLCNVFSTEFTVETVDMRKKQKYIQTWTQNMSKMGKARITSHSKGEDYTKITFLPDFRKFGMDDMDEDFEALVKRRVYDMAGTCKDVKVSLNKERIKVRNFKKYMEMYTKAIKAETAPFDDASSTDAQQVILTDNPHPRWEIGFAVSDGSFQQVSFVNSIATTSGGTHVNYIADQIVEKLMQIVKKKNKGGITLKPSHIRNHIFLFVNCLVVNPAFSSQTKEQLTTKQSQFGSKCTVGDKFLNLIAKTEAVNNILKFAEKKADLVLKKSDGNKRSRMSNSKLTDANKAGTKDGHQCTLILTEGDSASALALAGRAVVDPDRIGVFPLRGKLLNVRDASVDQISKNQEIQNIKKFMGFQHKKVYEDTKSLRYGHLMIMTDQDHDGSHIKGLLINFLEVTYPSLLKLPGFLQEFITPIVKVWKGDVKNPKKLQSFFTMPEYEAWKEIPGNARGWDHKYYKGLGTSTTADAEIYFRDPDKHLKEFSVLQPHEPELIDLAFSKKKADARKEWLRQFRLGTYLDMTTSEITYDDFINKELILFSMADNMRSIPSVVDGLKPGQRKVLYTCFRRNLKKDIKVVELAGSVSGLTAYAHGEASLQQTIVGLAQTFVGSNNINCLEPSGNFGSRLQGGSDCASARYIYTRLSPFARKIFHATDEPLLKCHQDDGKDIEPELYMPVVPMILVNGADGIGTGWSSNIPNYNPEDIVDNLKRRMAGSSKDDMQAMKPWFRGWSGEVEDLGGDRFKFPGIIRQTGDNEVEITELPVRMWTQDFKDKLEDIIKAEKVPSFIKDYAEYNTPLKVHFIIKMEDKHMKESLQRGLEDTFKLSKSMITTNLVAFDPQGRIHKYATVLDIMEEFYLIRLKYYEARRKHLLNEMETELEKMNNQASFIQMIIDGKLVISKKKKAALVTELREKGFRAFPKVTDARKAGEFEPVAENDEDEADEAKENQAIGASDYDYLLGMAIWSLTQERIERLKKQIGDKEDEYKTLTNTSSKQLWEKDLEEFLMEWRFQLEDEANRAKKSAHAGRRASAKLRIGGKGGAKKRKAGDSDGDFDFAVTKPKKGSSAMNGKAKASSAFEWMNKKATSPPAKPKPASQSLISAFGQKSSQQAEDSKKLVALDGAPEDLPADEPIEVPSAATKKPATAAPKGKTKAPAKKKISDDEDEDMFVEVAKEVKTKAALGGRQPRAAARKPVKYANSASEDDGSEGGDDLLGDVSNMVRGIPKGTTANGQKSLFSASASRPSSSSSHGLVSNSNASRAVQHIASDDEDDETDYKSLVPKDSPQKPAARNAGAVVLSDDEDDSLAMAAPKAALQSSAASKAAPASSAAASKPKQDKAPAQRARKPVAKDKQKPSSDLSPAAKAYAAKLAKGKDKSLPTSKPPPAQPKLTASKKSKAVESDEEDADALADDILGDEDDEDDEEPVAPRAATRPSRRAAASNTKSKYVDEVDDDDDDDEVSDFDDDGSD